MEKERLVQIAKEISPLGTEAIRAQELEKKQEIYDGICSRLTALFPMTQQEKTEAQNELKRSFKKQRPAEGRFNFVLPRKRVVSLSVLEDIPQDVEISAHVLFSHRLSTEVEIHQNPGVFSGGWAKHSGIEETEHAYYVEIAFIDQTHSKNPKEIDKSLAFGPDTQVEKLQELSDSLAIVEEALARQPVSSDSQAMNWETEDRSLEMG